MTEVISVSTINIFPPLRSCVFARAFKYRNSLPNFIACVISKPIFKNTYNINI